MTARPWVLITSSLVWLALASCSAGDEPSDPTDESSQEVAGCTAVGNTGVCNVGVSASGFLAVQYRNAWWSIDFADGYWALENNVSATPLTVTPTYTSTFYNPCDSLCNSCSQYTGSGQTACQNACNSCRASNPPTTTTETLSYTVAISGHTYNLQAYQSTMDTRGRSTDNTLETRSQVSAQFQITTIDPDDGNTWNVLVLPKRNTSTTPPPGSITVVAGTYGGNAGVPHGNVTSALASACNGRGSCDYTVSVAALGDPAPGQAKDYVAEWRCGSDAPVYSTTAPAEAGFGSVVRLSCGQEVVNQLVTDGAVVTGNQGTLVTSTNTVFTSEVELHGAYKQGATTSPEMIARSNTALNRALDTTLPTSSTFQQHFIPEAIQTLGNVSHITPMGSSTGVYDMTRFTQFYLDNRKGQAGWSTQGTGEQPQAESGPRVWTWRHRIFNYSVHFPFLAGICGLDAGVSSYISGSLTYGLQSCFDGLLTTIDASGKLEFDASAYGALGCNILVASAQAGLESTINAGFEFSTHLQTVPPQLVGSVDIYSNLDFHGFFRVRVLFWSKKWEKTIFNARLFQKHAEYDLGPTVSIPSQQICDATQVPRGTCADPNSSCDITGNCVRYDFPSPTDPPTRVITGACLFNLVSTKLAYEGSCTHLACCAASRIATDITQGQTPPAGYSVCPDASKPALAIHEGERGCGLNSVTNTRTKAFTPGFACLKRQPAASCDSTTQLWLSGPVGDCDDRIVCYGGNQVQVPLYDHADSNKLWEASTKLVDQVGGPGVTVHIYSVGDPAIAADPLCHH
jgi:hypothetical protein